MIISKVVIENYKCYKNKFILELNRDVNILVGGNEAGKSTIIEAIYLALTGYLHGKQIKNYISSYLFNREIAEEYLSSFYKQSSTISKAPFILIELYFDDVDGIENILKGNDNSQKEDCCGIYLKIEFDEKYQTEYEEMVKLSQINSIPIEYYKVTWMSFAREQITAKSIPLKPALIDSSTYRLKNGSDIFINQIVTNLLEDKDKISIVQEHRKFQDSFLESDAVEAINVKIKDFIGEHSKDVNISSDLSSHNAWQSYLITCLDKIPFHHTSKSEQSIIKTELALANNKNQKSNLILVEELENHLSHSTLSSLLYQIEKKCSDKQVIISTHNSFVANKLGLNNIILLYNQNKILFSQLEGDTYNFFKKLSGYNTLRLLLCKVAVLVEGPSDELIFQKAYLEEYKCLPIHDGIDVISVGLTFKRFLELAKHLQTKIAVLTDNDGNFESNITNKYKDYKELSNIKIFADNRDTLKTLENQFFDANEIQREQLKKVLGQKKNTSNDELVKYMLSNKTEWALKIFETDSKNFDNGILFPYYILNAVRWSNEQK